MKKTILLSVVCTLLIVALILCTALYILRAPWKPRPQGMPTAVPEGEGWINLLDDEHRPLWRNITDETDIFAFEGDELHIFGRSLTTLRYVGYTGRPFSDFELHLEYRLARRTNSGVFLRVQEKDPVHRGFEVQVLDDHGKPPSYTSSGSIYDVVSPMFNMSRPTGEWNSFNIIARGHELAVYMNGWKVIDTDLSKMTETIGKFSVPFAELPLEGLIALQDHGGRIWYRNIYIRPLDGTTPEHDEAGDDAEMALP